MIASIQLIGEARGWLGVPFRHQGRNRAGVDCAGFVVSLLRACDALPPDYREPTNYPRRPNGELVEILRRYCVRADAAAPAALVVIRWPGEPLPTHVALCTGPTLIHAYQRARAVVENGYRGAWLRDTDSVWRLPTVRYE